MAAIAPYNDGDFGIVVRARINALIADYLSFEGNAGQPLKMIKGDFILDPTQATWFHTNDGTYKNGTFWYGSAGSSLLSQKISDSSYAGFTVHDSDKATMQVQNFTSGLNATLELSEDRLTVVSAASTFSFDGDADYSPNYNPFSFVQEKYVIPAGGTRPGNPLSGPVVFDNIVGYGTALVGVQQPFYIGSGDVSDLDSWSYGNRILFEAPTAGMRSTMQLHGASSAWDNRNGTTRTGISFNNNGAFTFTQLQAFDGTHQGSVVINSNGGIDIISDDPASKGVTGSADFSANYAPLSYIQKTYAENAYQHKDSDLQDLANLTYHLLLTNR